MENIIVILRKTLFLFKGKENEFNCSVKTQLTVKKLNLSPERGKHGVKIDKYIYDPKMKEN